MAKSQILTIILTALMVLSVFSCSNSTMGTNGEENVEFQIEQIVYEDSINGADGTIFYRAEIDLPVAGPDSLLNCIREWINEELGGNYSGTLNCDTDMLRSYASYYFENLDENEIPGTGTHLTIRKIDETDTYVTYLMQGCTYTHDANNAPIVRHLRNKNIKTSLVEIPFVKGMTFSKKDGARHDWEMFCETTILKSLLSHSIKEQYFENNDSDFVNAIDIMVKDTTDFPLPETDPWFVEDSIQFIYQPYEIAPYSVGLPTCRIAISDIVTILTPKAKELLK
ncbi:MAG: DUF3298 domain-containing protein [Prevotellaceae bacterium]|nr:DUF3298 domain-containing protein [Candidatus Colivivens equi]